MKKSNTISNVMKAVMIFMCFLSLLISIGSYATPENKKSFVKKDKKEQKENSEEENEAILKFCKYEALVPVAHFSVVYYCYFIFSAELVDFTETIVSHSPPLFTMSFFKTLFRMIISPNAP